LRRRSDDDDGSDDEAESEEYRLSYLIIIEECDDVNDDVAFSEVIISRVVGMTVKK
jgi:hypothetical protein|tara:strand:+ start:1997 stop:2164 length:168 start_codon:yes stop_codon:yes gene_type:complete